ncbi:hypothetical protein [Labilithrix luteola]|nr:hypothetical protein [Labilithrix luteola]
MAGSFGATLLASAPAHAGNEAAAQALFDEAKKLVGEKRYAEACPKFAESNRLDRGAGTLIHLADCYEKNGQVASAWATFTDAASAAQALGRKDWEDLARKRATTLEPKLSRIAVKVPSPTPGLEITRDGEKVAEPSWGMSLPVDPGTHTLEARAPGHESFKTTVSLTKPGETKEVVVPKLADLPASAQQTSSPVKAETNDTPIGSDTHAGGGQRTAGLVVGGVGIVGLAVGTITGLMATSKNKDSKDQCPNAGPCASREGVDANESAKSLATVSTVGFIAGGLLAAGGAVLYLTAPSGSSPKTGRLSVTPSVSKGSAGLSLGGTF